MITGIQPLELFYAVGVSHALIQVSASELLANWEGGVCKTHYGIQFPLVFLACASYHNVLQQLARISISLHGSFKVLRIVQQDCSVRLLQGA